MPFRRQADGQAMVETAIVLPLLFFVMWGILHTVRVCHNAIVLQSVAAEAARTAALAQPDNKLAKLSAVLETRRLLGRVTPIRQRRSSETIRPWRAFKGFGVVRAGAYVTQVEITSSFLPQRFLDWRLPLRAQTYTAQFPTEPAVPEEE